MSEHSITSLPLQRAAEVPFQVYKRRQTALARYRLYPLTAFYCVCAIFVLAIAFSTTHPWTAVAFFSAGCVTWTLFEYLFHRYVLHGRFPPRNVIRGLLYERLNPLDRDHRMRPFDGITRTTTIRPRSASTAHHDSFLGRDVRESIPTIRAPLPEREPK